MRGIFSDTWLALWGFPRGRDGIWSELPHLLFEFCSRWSPRDEHSVS